MKVAQFKSGMETIDETALAGDRRVMMLKSGLTLRGAEWRWLAGHNGVIVQMADQFIDIEEIAAVALEKVPESHLSEDEI
ncbi:hypothetical protein SAMN06265338_12617 [Rhodoblastus acidophilus]|uniref:Uncharacterized protein n=1 Tax=Rhodoblastus acidophilus TaxID=1074 RepID=A0A212SD42_RHOAC|nr:hypothetical protein [Rhodoblastus acidophilus]PPQ35580.1 hypothetical protein CKO16_20265 [Rhodoblastus acidophilus]RAI16995.1 hypothetical protein CH337_18465 [Rhodoblastus acidophilus]SNB83377.1 hypothetical protein SAMN06265338_12617 [Rhodoblastus acidophilus]